MHQIDVEDRVGLALGISFDAEQRVLHDHALGSQHVVNAAAAPLLAAIAGPGGSSVRDLLALVPHSGPGREEQVRDDVVALLRDLDSQALVRIRRRWGAVLRPSLWVADLVTLAARGSGSRVARRFPASTVGVARAVAQMLWLPVLAWAAAMAVLHVALREVNPAAATSAWTVAALTGHLAVTLLFTMWAHESGHLVALRRHGDDACFVACRGLRIAVVHRPVVDPRARMSVAVAGPALAVVVGCALWPLSLLDAASLEAYRVAPVVGAAHLLSLLPRCADGAMLAAALSDARTERGTDRETDREAVAA